MQTGHAEKEDPKKSLVSHLWRLLTFSEADLSNTCAEQNVSFYIIQFFRSK